MAMPVPTPPTPAAPWTQFVESTELEEHARAQQDWALRYEQLSSGAFHAQLHRVALPGLTLLREEIVPSTRQRGRLAEDVYGFALPLHGPRNVFFNGQRVLGPAIMCGRGHDIDLVTPENFSMIAVVAERALLNPLWERMYQKPLAAWLEKQLVIPVAAEKAQLLSEMHLKAIDEAHGLSQRCDDERALRLLRDEILIEWLETLPERVSTQELESAERRKALVNLACELMLSNAHEPLSLLDVCTRLGTSRRRLNYCFQEVLGTTPVRYLRALRLNGVRSDLRRAVAQTQVQDVAARWGFWHLSQFSHDYRELFGEAPSVTLRQARGRASSESS